MAVADLRQEYARAGLEEGAVDADPIRQFGIWFEEARAAGEAAGGAARVLAAGARAARAGGGGRRRTRVVGRGSGGPLARQPKRGRIGRQEGGSSERLGRWDRAVERPPAGLDRSRRAAGGAMTSCLRARPATVQRSAGPPRAGPRRECYSKTTQAPSSRRPPAATATTASRVLRHHRGQAHCRAAGGPVARLRDDPVGDRSGAPGVGRAASLDVVASAVDRAKRLPLTAGLGGAAANRAASSHSCSNRTRQGGHRSRCRATRRESSSSRAPTA